MQRLDNLARGGWEVVNLREWMACHGWTIVDARHDQAQPIGGASEAVREALVAGGWEVVDPRAALVGRGWTLFEGGAASAPGRGPRPYRIRPLAITPLG